MECKKNERKNERKKLNRKQILSSFTKFFLFFFLPPAGEKPSGRKPSSPLSLLLSFLSFTFPPSFLPRIKPIKMRLYLLFS